jgi:hypothetical protein
VRVYGEPGLLYKTELWADSWSLLVFALLAFAAGIPALSWFIISTNKAIVSGVMVWGHNMEEKWSIVLSKLASTGVALFTDFKCSCSNWAMYQLLAGFTVGIIPIFTARVDPGFIYLFLILYLAMIGMTAYRRPYRYRVNNAIELVAYIFLALFALVPIMRYHDTVVSPVAETVTLVIAILGPALGFLAFCWDGSATISAEDPTVPTPEMKEAIDARKKRKEQKYTTVHVKQWNRPAGEDQIEIRYRELQSVREQVIFETNPAKATPDATFYASHTKLVEHITDMYGVIDVLLDGATTNLVSRVLCGAVMLGFLALGAYLGSVMNVPLPGKCSITQALDQA